MSDQADALYRRSRHAADLADGARASFFLSTAIIFTLSNPVVKKDEIDEEARRWRGGASLCREALSGIHRARVDPTLAAALSVSADYFDWYATSIEAASKDSPYLIERNSRAGAGPR